MKTIGYECRCSERVYCERLNWRELRALDCPSCQSSSDWAPMYDSPWSNPTDPTIHVDLVITVVLGWECVADVAPDTACGAVILFASSAIEPSDTPSHCARCGTVDGSWSPIVVPRLRAPATFRVQRK